MNSVRGKEEEETPPNPNDGKRTTEKERALEPKEAVLLGLVQGLTEFLPVSSSGHLAIGQALLGIRSPGIAFEVLVHFATLVVIMAAFRRETGLLVGAAARLPRLILQGGLRRALAQEGDVRLLALVALGSVPAGVAGLLVRDVVGELFADVRAVGWALLVTGALLWASDRARPGRNALLVITPAQALVVGIAQACALVPGISRSGATIVAGLFAGLSREAAAGFSFLLAIPAILGATFLELKDFAADGVPLPAGAVLAGMAAAGLAGYGALRMLLRFVRAGRLSWFAYYAWAAGIAALLWAAGR